MAPKKDKTTTTKQIGNPLSNRVDQSLIEKMQDVALEHWNAELERLVEMYEHKGIFTGEKEYWKEIKFRNTAINSQLAHIKTLAQYVGGAVHPPQSNTVEEKNLAAEQVKKARKKIEKQKKVWDKKRKDFLQEKFGDDYVNYDERENK